MCPQICYVPFLNDCCLLISPKCLPELKWDLIILSIKALFAGILNNDGTKTFSTVPQTISSRKPFQCVISHSKMALCVQEGIMCNVASASAATMHISLVVRGIGTTYVKPCKVWRFIHVKKRFVNNSGNKLHGFSVAEFYMEAVQIGVVCVSVIYSIFPFTLIHRIAWEKCSTHAGQ